MLSALRASVQALLEAYPTTLEEDELLLQLSSFGPATRSAIVLRAREKDLLLRALVDLRDWEAALEAGKLSFQLAAIKERRDAAKLEQQRRQEVRERAVREMREQLQSQFTGSSDGSNDGVAVGGPLLARVACSDVVDDQGAPLPASACGGLSFEVRRGRSLEDDLNAFMARWGLSRSAAKQLGYQALEAVRLSHGSSPSAAPLLVWQPVLLPDGNLSVLSVREGEDPTFASQVFLAVQAATRNLTFTPDAERRLEQWVAEQARIRTVRGVLVDLNVSAPDGRTLGLKLRQGDQHELKYILGHWAAAEGLAPGVVAGLAGQLETRLRPKVKDFNIPAGQFVSGQRQLNLRVSEGDSLAEVVPVFCDVYRIPQSHVPAITDSIRKTLGL
jgi:hypothetical protein